jgi:hypothetical protein
MHFCTAVVGKPLSKVENMSYKGRVLSTNLFDLTKMSSNEYGNILHDYLMN